MVTKAERTIADRIGKASHWSYERLRPFREVRRKMLSQYAGMHYGDSNPSGHVPYNVLGLTIDVFRQRLTSGKPRFMLSTTVNELRPEAANLEAGLNAVAGRLDLRQTWDDIFIDALTSVGIAKVGVCRTPGVADDDRLIDTGQVYVDRVDFEDFVMDMASEHTNNCDFFGNRYRVPIDALMDSGQYSKRALDEVYADMGDDSDVTPYGEERASLLARDPKDDDSEIYDYATLWEMWLPRPGANGLIVTLCGQQLDTAKTLGVREFGGSDKGPYRMCSFKNMPGSPMPVPPLADVMDLHLAMNTVLCKILRQSQRQKRLTAVMQGQDDDARRMRDAADGDAVAITGGTPPAEFGMGGADNQSFALFLQLREVASAVGGNVDVLGGIASQAETLGQEEMLAGQASQRVVAMERRAQAFLTEIGRELSWYVMTDPAFDIGTYRRIDGVDYDIPVRITHDDLAGNPLDYDIEVAAYTLADEGPTAQLKAIDAFMERMIPFLPALEAQGLAIDMQALAAEYGRLMNAKSIGAFLASQTPPDERLASESPRGTMPRYSKPPVTTRRTERISRSAPSQKGRAHELAMNLLGKGNGAADGQS